MKIMVPRVRLGTDLNPKLVDQLRNRLFDVGRRTYTALDDAVGEVRQVLGEEGINMVGEYDQEPQDGSVSFKLEKDGRINNRLNINWHRLPKHYEVVITLT